MLQYDGIQFSSVQLLGRVRLFVTPWIAARQASLSITNSRSSPRFTSIESVMPSRHLILCCPLLLLPPIPPTIRVFSNESTLRMTWPKYWSFSFKIIPSKEHPGLISFRKDWLDLLAVQGTLITIIINNLLVVKWYLTEILNWIFLRILITLCGCMGNASSFFCKSVFVWKHCVFWNWIISLFVVQYFTEFVSCL